MDIKTAIDEMKRNPGPVLHRVLQRDGQSRGLALDDYTRGGYICPVCGSGIGREKNPDGTPKKEKGTGIKCHVVDGVPRFTCFAGHCFSNASIIDLIAIQHGLDPEDATQTGKIVRLAATEFGITIDDETDSPSPKGRKTRFESANAKRDLTHPKMKTSPQNAQNGPKTGDIDLRQKFEQCRAHLDDSSPRAYLTRRGLSVETARALGIGYNPDYSTMVIPLNSDTYLYRYINPDGTPSDELQSSGATAYPFNAGALKQSEPVFIVEGWEDAVSVAMCDGQAIALNSTQHTAALLSIIDKRTERGGNIPPIVLALDSDDAGRQCMEFLRSALNERGIPCIYRDLCTGITDAGGTAATDPNEALQWNPDALRDNVAAGIQLAMEQAGNGSSLQADKPETPIDPGTWPDTVTAYMQNELLADIEREQAGADRKTGFARLDAKMCGIPSGLYCLAATSSLGKTTFMLQMACNMAAQGEHVMYFSLEQTRLELVAKCIGRMNYMQGGSQFTARDIRQGRYTNERDAILQQIDDTWGRNLHIINETFALSVSNIQSAVREFIAKTGVTPVIIVDYLQIVQPDSQIRYATRRDAVDGVLYSLKRLSGETGCPVFVISSVNRGSYITPIDFESLKESGNIEYTADVIWGLQLSCLKGEKFQSDLSKDIVGKRKDIREAKAAIPRMVDLVCIKNRFGISSYEISFSYDPRYDYFKEVGVLDAYSEDYTGPIPEFKQISLNNENGLPKSPRQRRMEKEKAKRERMMQEYLRNTWGGE